MKIHYNIEREKRVLIWIYAELITMEHVKKVLLVALPINSHHPSQQDHGSNYPPFSQEHVFWEVWDQAIPSPEDGSQLGETKDS